MFFPESRIRIFVYGEPVDMRKSYDGLYAIAKQAMGQDPTSGHLFVFINRRGNMLKSLYWDRNGFCLWSKRLEQGVFVRNWNRMSDKELDWTRLKLLLEGLEESKLKPFRRYKEPHKRGIKGS